VKRALIMAVLLGVLASACSSGTTQLTGIVRTPAPISVDYSLPDMSAGGEPFFLRAPEGGLLLVFFGYTACPDVCPTTLADIRTALADLGDDAERIEVAMATVDPGRDTDEMLTRYVQSFIPSGHALRTEKGDALLEVAAVLGAAYEVSVNDEGRVEVIHTAHVYVIDDRGELLVTWPFGLESVDIVSDLEVLLDRR